MKKNISEIKPLERKYLPKDFKIKEWDTLKEYFQELLSRPIDDLSSMKKLLEDWSEIECALEEEMAWRYIRMTCDTSNKEHQEAYQEYMTSFLPKTMDMNNQINKRVNESPLKEALRGEEGMELVIKNIETALQIFKKKNVPIISEMQLKQQEYTAIISQMTIQRDGEELTLQQAAVDLEKQDRSLREQAFREINERRQQDVDRIHDIYTDLIQKRHQIAKNAGFDRYTDYMFIELKRYDYTPQDCLDFHDAVAEEVTPLVKKIMEDRKAQMGLEVLKPWDTSVDPSGKPPLKPFKDTDDLTEKTIAIFNTLDPAIGDCLKKMKKMGHLDLTSRKGKGPGGYNYPLYETGVPFIFMNATTTLDDLITLIHEGGHALHAFLTHELPLAGFKQPGMEVCELASMSMELLTLDTWDVCFEDPDEARRAKKTHLAHRVVPVLSWVAIIDKFQHWVYDHPHHSLEERTAAWNKIHNQFSTGMVDWAGLEHYRDSMWQKQLHLFEVPFYYIEYAIAQLGAIAMWRNFKKDRSKGLESYLNALSLGSKASMAKVYEAGNISFRFDKAYVKELVSFVQHEWESL